MGMMINRRRVMGNKKGLLPSGYTQIEYIQSNGTQYIDTGVTLKSNSKIELIAIDFTRDTPFGVDTSNGQYCIASGGGSMYYRLFSNFGLNIGSSVGKHTYSFTGNKGYYDGAFVYTGGTPTYSTLNLYLFARNINGVPQKFGTGKICLFEIDNHKFIPCRRDSDNTVGMYDTVEGNFYSSPNGKAFIAGNPV